MNDQSFGSHDGGTQGKKKMSGLMKFILIMLFLLGGAVAVCCCGGYLFSRNMVIETEPTAILKSANEIAELKLPERFAPVSSFGMQVPFVEDFKVKVCTFAAEDSSTFMLTSVNLPTEEGREGQLERDISKGFGQGGQGKDHFEDIAVELRPVVIEGRELQFKFSTLRSVDNGAEFKSVQGTFPGKNGLAFLQFRAPSSVYDEAEVMEILASIHTGHPASSDPVDHPDHAGEEAHSHDLPENEAAAKAAAEAARAAAARQATIEAEQSDD